MYNYRYGPDESLAASRQERDLLYAARMQFWYWDELAEQAIYELANEFRSDENPSVKYGDDIGKEIKG